MTGNDYNYAVFDMAREQPTIDGFKDLPLRAGMRAPSFVVEDLDTGEPLEMKELWRDRLVVIEFGSFT